MRSYLSSCLGKGSGFTSFGTFCICGLLFFVFFVLCPGLCGLMQNQGRIISNNSKPPARPTWGGQRQSEAGKRVRKWLRVSSSAMEAKREKPSWYFYLCYFALLHRSGIPGPVPGSKLFFASYLYLVPGVDPRIWPRVRKNNIDNKLCKHYVGKLRFRVILGWWWR
ncbi:hypothetical protein BDQ94DRAFT_15050 [Aspergillus welwitschiae]|uniref:Uncharacterized protein n=1 Tax=Aspergillus welwitschiae TaxID=1341132 RepID=A0A3F3Q6E9_9EURO|nr:hypothetical protein BDQ94DRAFT_15050 [Aspergillus welwitschiae]RDH34748.1 hypothetical protein BDQ94DRAFT_15050 [Aspergillus welwitschiae]